MYANVCMDCGVRLGDGLPPKNRDLTDSLITFVIAVIAWAVLYKFVFNGKPEPTDPYIYRVLFTHIVCRLIVLIFLWGLFYLIRIGFAWLREASYLRMFNRDEFRNLIEEGITEHQVERILEMMPEVLDRDTMRGFAGSLSFARFRTLIDYLKAVPSKEEIQKILEYSARLDESRLNSRFHLIRVLIWALPIMGFIGTILGISKAITGFSTGLGGQSTSVQTSYLLEGLGDVSIGLSTAFDTTFLGLILVIPLMFLMTFILKGFNDFLHRLEQYFLTSVAPYLFIGDTRNQADAGGGRMLKSLSEGWAEKMSPVMTRLRDTMDDLESRLNGIGGVLSDLNRQTLGDSPAPSKRPEKPVKPDRKYTGTSRIVPGA